MPNLNIEYLFDNPMPVAKYFVNNYEGTLGEIKLYALLYWAFGLVGNASTGVAGGPNYRLYRCDFVAAPFGVVEKSLDTDVAFNESMTEDDHWQLEISGVEVYCDYLLNKVEKMDDLDVVNRIHESFCWWNSFQDGVNKLPIEEGNVILEYREF